MATQHALTAIRREKRQARARRMRSRPAYHVDDGVHGAVEPPAVAGWYRWFVCRESGV